jgi:formylglycine-generating enzyme required for sulfatase activity
LRKWDEGKRLGQLDEQLAARDEQLERRQGRAWYVNREKQTMVIVRGPASFRIGSPATERNRDPGKVELQHEVPLGHSFAIDAHEVTIEEFLRFSPNHKYDENVARDITNGQVNVRCPVNRVSWYRAASYCDWLSKQDGIAPDQWCYPLDAHDEFVAGMKPFDDFLNRAGYRLPTEAEWEFACRAGTTTARYFGQTDELLAKYAWFQGNSNKISRAVGLLKPNDFGLFDMLGNALEWCEDASPSGRDEFGFPPDAAPIIDSVPRVARGEKFLSLPENVRAARRDAKHSPSNQDFILGFRPVRTYPTGNSDR